MAFLFSEKMDITLTGTAFTDETHANVGASAFNLDHDFFIDDDSSGENLIIRTAAAGGGTLLTRDTDYTISNQDSYLSTESGYNTYSDITVINAAYQATTLYFSGKYIADSVESTDINWINNLVWQYTTASASATLAPTGHTCYGCTASTNGIRLTLPTSSTASTKNLKLEFIKLDATNSAVTLVPAGAETINGLSFIFLIEQYQKIELINTGAGWLITKGSLFVDSGWVSRNDWTNVHIGSADITFDGKSGTFLTGELVKEATSNNTGIIVGQTATVLYIWRATGTGIWTNDRVITGQISLATANVNNASTTKNLDANFYHGLGVNVHKLSDFNLWYNTAANETGAKYVINTGAADVGWVYDNVDTSSLLIQVGNLGCGNIMTSSGVTDQLTTEDSYYRVTFRFII